MPAQPKLPGPIVARRSGQTIFEICVDHHLAPRLRDGVGMFSTTAPLVRVATTIIP